MSERGLSTSYLQQIASILTYPQVDVTPASQASLSSRSHTCIMQCGSCSPKTRCNFTQVLGVALEAGKPETSSTLSLSKWQGMPPAPRPSRGLFVLNVRSFVAASRPQHLNAWCES